MRLLALTFLLYFANDLCAQVITIRDSLLKIPIENANLTFQDIGRSSDNNGRVNLNIFDDESIIQISHIAYKSKNIAKKNISNNIIYLNQKINVLPTVFLTNPTKIPLTKSNSVFTIRPSNIQLLESSASELLSTTSHVVIQESQAGGGSPNYRGMEANRLLLIVDEIPLNNAIYRSGHLQNSATINPFFIESINLISGPASVAYGNGSMGGALIFYTKNPSNKKRIRLHQQFESSSNSVITNIQAFYHKKKLSHITGFNLKSAGNLKMGRQRMHGYNSWGKELSDQNEQLYTNYEQADFIHKSKYSINDLNNILINTQYSATSNIYRFDKMNDIKNGSPKYAQWYYGPQIRFLQSLNYTSKYKTIAYDNIKLSLAFQDIQESRNIQLLDDELLNRRKEKVSIYDVNIDLKKKINTTRMHYGIGVRNQNVNSTAALENGTMTFYNTTRYPEGGSLVQDIFAYSQIKFAIYNNLEVLIGGRLNKEKLLAKFNNTIFELDDIQNNNISFIKSMLLSYKIIKSANINLSYYDGFRNPNVDDIGKVFSKDGINVVVPNINLEPEYSNNLEFAYNLSLRSIKIQVQLFNTKIYNAINREYATFNGVDSMLYDGEMMRIQMNKNIEAAEINGVNFSANFIIKNCVISAECNYLEGITNEKKPLAHIPPFNAKISFNYQLNQHLVNFSTHYNAWKKASKYDEEGVDNLAEATEDGTPSWYTLNLMYSNKIDDNITLMIGVKNILDAHYKAFGSSLSSSGRNFILCLRTSF